MMAGYIHACTYIFGWPLEEIDRLHYSVQCTAVRYGPVSERDCVCVCARQDGCKSERNGK